MNFRTRGGCRPQESGPVIGLGFSSLLLLCLNGYWLRPRVRMPWVLREAEAARLAL